MSPTKLDHSVLNFPSYQQKFEARLDRVRPPPGLRELRDQRGHPVHGDLRVRSEVEQPRLRDGHSRLLQVPLYHQVTL